MARRKKRGGGFWLAGPMWLGVMALVGWGLWQATVFLGSMRSEARAAAQVTFNAPQDPETLPAASPATDAPPSSPSDSPPTAQTLAAQTPSPAEDWAAATTPAEIADAAPDASPPDAAANDPAAQSSPVGDTPADSVDTLLTQGTAALDDGQIIDGRWALNAALNKMGDDKRAPHLRQLLAGLNAEIFLGSSVVAEDPAAKFVTIEPGDSFLKLGHRYSIPPALLETINPGLNPRNLKPLAGVKVVEGPFHIKVFKRAGRIDLYARDIYVKSFPSQVEEGNYLPVGTYRVSAGDKIQVGARLWVGIERITEVGQEPLEGWLYGSAGPRMEKGLDRASGVKISDADLAQLYNVLVERKSLVRVEP